MGVYGMAGCGKSSALAAVAADQDVRQSFPHGVYVARLGRRPGVACELQSELLRTTGCVSRVICSASNLKSSKATW